MLELKERHAKLQTAYLDEMPGVPLQDYRWTDIRWHRSRKAD